jgi:hypothetical protein
VVAGSVYLDVPELGQFQFIPVPIAPSFLPSLQYITDSAAVTGSSSVNIVRAPSFTTLRQAANFVVVDRTTFADMTSFSGLICAPGVLGISGNAQMTSLTGLEGVLASPLLRSVQIIGNQRLRTARAFAPLISLLGCVGSGAGSTGLPTITNVYVDVAGCPSVIQNIDRLCAFVTSAGTTACLP